MRFVRRYWAPLLSASLIPLLVLLAVFQMRWIGELGDRERFRLGQGLFAAANQFASAFQDQVGVLPAVFGRDPHSVEESVRTGDWSSFDRRLDIWKAYAIDPGIASDFFIVDGGGAVPLKRWDGKGFAPFAAPDLQKAFIAGVAARKQHGGRLFLAPVALGDRTEAFLFPASPSSDAWLAVRIDQQVLNHKLIPALAERYLYAKNEYYFRIIDRAGDETVYSSDPGADPLLFAKPDLTLPLLRGKMAGLGTPPPDFLAEGDGPNAGPDAGPNLGPDRLPDAGPPNGPGPRPGDGPRFSDAGGPDKSPDRDARQGAQQLRSSWEENSPLGDSRWILEAVHKSGSLVSAVHASTVRSLAVTMGVLIILGVVLLVLAMAVRRTQELADRRQEFIASVTHELKTPVAVIRSAAENLADGVITAPERTSRYGFMIAKESARLTEMIDSLLVYARVGDSAARRNERIDLAELVREITAHLEELLRQANFHVELDLPLEMRVVGDSAALEVVVNNLVVNAIKHAASGRYLRLELRAEKIGKKGWATLKVRDKGPGVPRKERGLVYDPFYRGEAARQNQTPGSGIGLNLVKRIVVAHEGSISLETPESGGCLFTIRIPLEDYSNA